MHYLEIFKNFHLAHIALATDDRNYKVHALFEKLIFIFKEYGEFVNTALMKAEFPINGKPGTKQCVR